MRVLVAYGSSHGATAELAETVAETLREGGHVADVRDAATVDDLSPWDAAVIGGALYASFWTRAARRFLMRHRDELAVMPVWLFSSGPLDESASQRDIPPTASVARYLARVGARGHVTFGGRLSPDAKGFPASAMAKNGMAGDFRDMDAVRAWATEVAAELDRLPAPTARPPRASRGLRGAVAVLCGFTGLTAIAGGLELAIWPHGAPWAPWLDPAILDGSPFSDFLVPGLLLAVVVGGLNAVAAALLMRRAPLGEPVGFVAGGALTVWIVVEAILLWSAEPLQWTYFVVGVLTALGAGVAWWRRRAIVRARRAAQPGDAGARSPATRGTTGGSADFAT